MSVRALKKRENQQLSVKQGYNTSVKSTLYKKLNNSNNFLTQQQRKYLLNTGDDQATTKRGALLGRHTQSSPELHKVATGLNKYTYEHLLRTKSENDISIISELSKTTKGAKSEVCLKTISTHNYQQQAEQPKLSQGQLKITTTVANPMMANNNTNNNSSSSMLSGARSHRDLTQTANTSVLSSRRMSESNSGIMRSNTSLTSTSISTSTLNTSSGSHATELSSNAVLRVPIIGYEVMEERARFTVYKLRVENPLTNDCWLVLRRYTDFVRLNSKLKQSHPHINLLLPRKKIFGDNFNAVFLDNRVQGLQMFVNSIMSREDLRKTKIVREFFCLDEPPTYSESMEECRAIFEAQEETIAHMKLQINSKNDLILSLQQKLREEIMEKHQLKELLKNLSKSTTLNSSPGSSANSSTASN